MVLQTRSHMARGLVSPALWLRHIAGFRAASAPLRLNPLSLQQARANHTERGTMHLSSVHSALGQGVLRVSRNPLSRAHLVASCSVFSQHGRCFVGCQNSSSITTEASSLEDAGLPLENSHAQEIFKMALNAVEPRSMVEELLQFDPKKSELTVGDQTYKVKRNVYVVGAGKAVLGMARAVEDLLGDHVKQGMLVIPSGQRQVLADKGKHDLLLKYNSKIEVFEGGHSSVPESSAYEAALAIEQMLQNRVQFPNDIVICLVSGGGSPLMPLPQEPVTFEDLCTVTTLLLRKGASLVELNTIRKNFERLKGGKMIDVAYPAQVVSLILSDIIGDPLSMIAAGPTVRDQPTAHQCLEIMNRYRVRSMLPPRVLEFLKQQQADEDVRVRYKKRQVRSVLGGRADHETSEADKVQNVLVGSNSKACEAAGQTAWELGYLPYLLTTELGGDAKVAGELMAKVAAFVLYCFQRQQARSDLRGDMLRLELAVVSGGISKQQVNEMSSLVDKAVSTGRDIVIIAGGSTTIASDNAETVRMGGRNHQLALGAALELQELFNLKAPKPNSEIFLLSADTDGEDGAMCPAAGVVVTENFVKEAELEGLSVSDYLANDEAHELVKRVSGGQGLVVTRETGTNVMDIQVIVIKNIQKPQSVPNKRF